MTAPDLRVPLSTVPVGDRVVHDRKVWVVGHREGGSVQLGPDRVWSTDTILVLHLDGDASRPLRECEGLDVWDPYLGKVWLVKQHRQFANKSVLYWPIIAPQPEPAAEPAYRVGRSLGTTIYREGEDQPCGWFPSAPGLAEHVVALLNGPPVWTPPEPERPTLDDLLAPAMHDWRDRLAEHGYRVVDVRALGGAIGWLRRLIGTSQPPNYAHARDLLAALGADDG